ncbi:MAG: hypothetical protein GXP40_12855 [Chloroflexi bacterium]|nr:hypothetical protein [Chloroflexota bacterium]
MTRSAPAFSTHLLKLFIETTSAEVGRKNLPTVLTKSGLPTEWADPAAVSRLGGQAAAEAYAGLQRAIRTYYGRGARGILQRIGCNLWPRMRAKAPLLATAQANLIRNIPERMRRKSILDLLARLLSAKSGDITIHTLDLDLLLVDRASPTTYNQRDDEPICYVTQGLIREALYWATNREPDVEEISCQAAGAQTCEFKISFGERS